MDVWFCVTRRNRAERHNRELMNTLSEATRRSPERYGKALPHLTKTYHGSRLSAKWVMSGEYLSLCRDDAAMGRLPVVAVTKLLPVKRNRSQKHGQFERDLSRAKNS
jgi:hypothetical protein